MSHGPPLKHSVFIAYYSLDVAIRSVVIAIVLLSVMFAIPWGLGDGCSGCTESELATRAWIYYKDLLVFLYAFGTVPIISLRYIGYRKAIVNVRDRNRLSLYRGLFVLADAAIWGGVLPLSIVAGMKLFTGVHPFLLRYVTIASAFGILVFGLLGVFLRRQVSKHVKPNRQTVELP